MVKRQEEENMAKRGEHIRKRKDGRWEGRYVEKRNDQSKMRSVYAKSYSEVKQKLLVAKCQLSSITEQQENVGILVQQVAEEWLQEVKEKRKYATYVKYRNVYQKHIFPNLENVEITQLSIDKVNECISGELSNNSIKGVYCVLNQISAFGANHYNTQPFKLVRTTRYSRLEPVKILNQTEQNQLVKVICQDMDIYKAGIYLCLATGLRLGEICALRWSDVDTENHMIYVRRTVQRIAVENEQTKTILLETPPKTLHSIRDIPIPEQVSELLKRYKKDNIYVLGTNSPMEPRTYQYKFSAYLATAGIEKKNFHILRHTFATNCISNGADVKSVSEILGHSDVKITLNRYVHPSLNTKRNYLNNLVTQYGQCLGQTQ